MNISLPNSELEMHKDASLSEIGFETLLCAVDAHAITIIADSRGIVYHVSDSFCLVSGYHRDELLGKSFMQLESGYHPESFWTVMWEQISVGNTWNGQICKRTKPGSLFWVQTTVCPLRNDEGDIFRFLALCTDITVQKETEEKLRSSQRLLQDAARLAKVGSWELNLLTQELFWSSQIKSIHEVGQNFKPDIDTGLNFIEEGYYHEKISRLLEHATTSGEGFDEEIKIITAKGNCKWVRAICNTDFIDGRCLRLYGVLQDIDENKNILGQKRRNDSLASNLMQSARDFCMIGTDTEGTITFFSKGAELMLGYQASEMVGKQTPAILHRSDEMLHRASELSEALGRDVGGFGTFTKEFDLGKESDQREWTYVRKDGSEFPVSLGITQMRGPNGQVEGYLGIAVDISEREATLSALRESEQRLQLAARSGEIGIWHWDLPNNEFVVDDQMLKIYNVTREYTQTNPLHWREAFHPDDLERADANMALALSGQAEDVKDEFRIYWSNGELRHLRTMGAVQRDKAGNPVAIIGVTWDVTEEATRREELARLAEQAKQASEAKSQFLANMSHEIRTPMNGVIGMTTLLLDSEGLSTQQRQYAEVIRTSGEALLALINDILDFSKVEAGKLELEILDFHLRSSMDDFMTILSLQAKERGLDFVCEVDPHVPERLRGDPGRLRQILLNLASNALKFTREGSVKIRVGLAEKTDLEARQSSKESEDCDSQSETVLRFSVTDTGIGISKDAVRALFEEFTQADTSTTRLYGGTGLGLAISQQLVHLMGGEIGVNSEEGKGSEFWFTVRLAVLEETDEDRRCKEAFAGRSALIVAQSKEVYAALENQLAQWQIRSTVCTLASKARVLLNDYAAKAEKIDYLLFDPVDNDESIRAFTKAIKQNTASGNINIILLGEIGHKREFIDSRFSEITGYISKPLRKSEVFNALIELERNPQYTALTGSNISSELLNERASKILLAEDNSVNQLVVRGVLDKFGLHADVAANGEEALEALKTIPYDLVLMDVQMPVMDGLRATRLLRAGEAGELNRNIPVVALTAHARNEHRQSCLDSGMNAYLSKPLAPRELFSELDRLLPRRGAGDRPVALESFNTNVRAKVANVERINSEINLSEPKKIDRNKIQSDPAPIEKGEIDKSANEQSADKPRRAHQGPVFDSTWLLHETLDEIDLAKQVALTAIQSLGQQMDIATRAMNNGDLKIFERSMHLIESQGASCGSIAIRNLAKHLRQLAVKEDSEKVRVILPNLEALIDILVGELVRFCQE